MRKNLLIGAITNYTWDDIAPFFNSYMQAGFENCDCVMFTGNMSEPTLARMRACGVKILPIPERLLSGCVIDYRWELYSNYMLEQVNNYGLVFTADVRDAIFQRDVFSFYDTSKPFLGIALEDCNLTQPCNKNWLISRYGYEVWDSLKDRRTICTGTVWGTAQVFLDFSLLISEHINSTDYPYYKVCDQAAGNWLIYYVNNFAELLKPSTNYDGPVMTIGLTDAKDIHIDSAGNVLNGKGEIAAVVHQYDRKPQVIHLVVKKYTADMSLFAKLKLKHNTDIIGHIIGRVMRFMSRVHRNGLIVTTAQAIKRRIHRIHQ